MDILQAAVNRILTLVDATEEQLDKLDDVCAICYGDMSLAAKVTPCGHFFHGGCLRKWLFVQDHCPLCSAKVIEDQNEAEDPREVVEEHVALNENAPNENDGRDNVDVHEQNRDLG